MNYCYYGVISNLLIIIHYHVSATFHLKTKHSLHCFNIKKPEITALLLSCWTHFSLCLYLHKKKIKTGILFPSFEQENWSITHFLNLYIRPLILFPIQLSCTLITQHMVPQKCPSCSCALPQHSSGVREKRSGSVKTSVFSCLETPELCLSVSSKWNLPASNIILVF